jgi:hypothetical protein
LAVEIYSNPELLIRSFFGFPASIFATGTATQFFIEAAKWCIVFTIAVWLTIAQVAAWWKAPQPLEG